MAIFLDIGHGGRDPGGIIDGANERDELRSVLLPHVDGLPKVLPLILVPPFDDEKHMLRQRMRWVRKRATPDDDLVSVHLNAGPPSATGVEVFYNPDKPDATRAFFLASSLSHSLGLRNRGAKNDTQSARGSLAICRGKPHGFVLECGFLTNPGDLLAWRTRGLEAVSSTLIKWAQSNG